MLQNQNKVEDVALQKMGEIGRRKILIMMQTDTWSTNLFLWGIN